MVLPSTLDLRGISIRVLGTCFILSGSCCGMCSRGGERYKERRDALAEFIYASGRPVQMVDDLQPLLQVYDPRMPRVSPRQVALTVCGRAGVGLPEDSYLVDIVFGRICKSFVFMFACSCACDCMSPVM